MLESQALAEAAPEESKEIESVQELAEIEAMSPTLKNESQASDKQTKEEESKKEKNENSDAQEQETSPAEADSAQAAKVVEPVDEDKKVEDLSKEHNNLSENQKEKEEEEKKNEDDFWYHDKVLSNKYKLFTGIKSHMMQKILYKMWSNIHIYI